MSTTEHFLIPHYDPPVYGDRPEPWRRYATCACGEELWDEEEGRGSTPGTPEDALEEHIAELEGPTCDECDERTDLTTWAHLRHPVTLCPACEHDARRSGWEPGTPEGVARAAALAVSTSSSRPAIQYLQQHRP